MSGVSELPSSTVEFVDDTLMEVFEDADGEPRVKVLVRPVCSRSEFLAVVQDEQIGVHWDELGYESLSAELSEEEGDLLLENEVVEAIEVNQPVQLI